MQITSIPPVLPVSSANNQAAQPRQADLPPSQANAPLQPAPALRPTLQDDIEMTRTLLALREI